MLRLIIVALIVIIFLILSLPIQLVLWLLSKKWPTIPDKVSYPLVNGCFKLVLFFAGVKLTVIGRDKVPEDKAVMYVGNHRSFFDIVTTYPLIKRPTGYLAKKELGKIPGLNIWMSLMHCIFLDRTDIKQGLASILNCIELIKRGISVNVFPEGTRSRVEGEFLPFHDASFKIALKSGCPIQPMVLVNTGAIFEDHLPFIKSTHVIIEYLDPIDPASLTPEQKKHIGEYFRNMIIEAYSRNKANL